MKADIIHVAGFDTYNTHDSGNYIVFDHLRELKHNSIMLLALSKTKNDNDTYFITKDKIVDSIQECKILILHDELLSIEEVEKIHKKTNCKIVIVTQTHCHLVESGMVGDLSYPELNTEEQNNFNRDILLNKKEYIQKLPINLVVVSSHTKKITENFYINVYENKKINLIPFPSTIPYCDSNKKDLKEKYNLSSENKYILWGTTQPESLRKGKDYFDASLKILYQKLTDKQRKIVKILNVGPKPKTVFGNNEFETIYLGYLKTRKHMSLAYKMADISVCTTLSDAGPMMISESMCNNTPVIAFDRSLANDLIIDGKSGYIIKNLSPEDMAQKIYKILFEDNIEIMRENARINYLNFHNKENVLKKWQELFNNLLGETNG